ISMPNLLMSRYALRAPSQVMKEREVQQEAARTATPQINSYDSLNSLTKTSDLNGLASVSGSSGGTIGMGTKSGTNAKRGAGEGEIDETEGKPGVPAVPMIARTAALTLVAKEFDKTRAGLEEILKRHNGYIGELNVSAPAEAGRTLTATLRIPGPQLEAA